MERLTKRTPERTAYLAKVKDDEQEIQGHKHTLECMLESWQKLAHYEDLEGQGLLHIAPCKMQDTIYSTSEGEATETEIACLTIERDGSLNIVTEYDHTEKTLGLDTVLTREEIEKALKEREGK